MPIDPETMRMVAAYEEVLQALIFYADPASYHALAVVPDHPCGEFYEDVSDDHGDDFYQRPMHGKRARAALKAWNEALQGAGLSHDR